MQRTTEEGVPLVIDGDDGVPDVVALRNAIVLARQLDDVEVRAARFVFLGEALLKCDEDEAVAEGAELLAEAIELGSGEASLTFGLLLLETVETEKDFDEALDYVRFAAEDGVVEGARWFGALLLRHPNTREVQHARMAVAWLRAAIAGGSIDALPDLAEAHVRGNGVPRSVPEARRLLQLAVDAGDTSALLRLNELADAPDWPTR